MVRPADSLKLFVVEAHPYKRCGANRVRKHLRGLLFCHMLPYLGLTES